jgi:hypothetical protein
MEDLERYLRDFVDPTIADFEANPTSVRHAFLACVVVFHGIDYLAHPRSSRSLRNQFRNESREFAIVDRVAHAFKHVTTRGLDPLHASEVISRPPVVFDQAVFDLSCWDDPIGGVILDDDHTIDLFAVAKAAAVFLRSKTFNSERQKLVEIANGSASQG